MSPAAMCSSARRLLAGSARADLLQPVRYSSGRLSGARAYGRAASDPDRPAWQRSPAMPVLLGHQPSLARGVRKHYRGRYPDGRCDGWARCCRQPERGFDLCRHLVPEKQKPAAGEGQRAWTLPAAARAATSRSSASRNVPVRATGALPVNWPSACNSSRSPGMPAGCCRLPSAPPAAVLSSKTG